VWSDVGRSVGRTLTRFKPSLEHCSRWSDLATMFHYCDEHIPSQSNNQHSRATAYLRPASTLVENNMVHCTIAFWQQDRDTFLRGPVCHQVRDVASHIFGRGWAKGFFWRSICYIFLWAKNRFGGVATCFSPHVLACEGHDTNAAVPRQFEQLHGLFDLRVLGRNTSEHKTLPRTLSNGISIRHTQQTIIFQSQSVPA